MVQKISQRVIRMLRRLGYTWRQAWTRLRPQAMTPCVMTRPNSPVPWRPPCSSASLWGAGWPEVRRIGAGFGTEGEAPTLTGPRCASVQGFSLHANTQVPAHRRDQLERLIRYTARGAVSLERLQEDANGDLLYTFTHPWSDGTAGIRLSPLELLESSRRWCPCRASIWCAMAAV